MQEWRQNPGNCAKVCVGGPGLQDDTEALRGIGNSFREFGSALVDEPWRGYTYDGRGALTGVWEHQGVDATGLDHSSLVASNNSLDDTDIDNFGAAASGAVDWTYQREPSIGSLESIFSTDTSGGVRWEASSPTASTTRKDGHRLDMVEVDQTSFAIAHNEAGEVTEAFDYTLHYGPDGRLIQVDDASGNMLEAYAYDADGRLAAVFDGYGLRETYAYDGEQMIAAFGAAGLPLWEAVWGAKLDQLVAFYSFADDDTYLPLIDHRNSIVGTWSTAGRQMDALAEYSPHGRMKLYDADETPDCPAAGATEEYCLDPTKRPSGLPFGFVSAWQSPATGFVYMRNRWYSPRLAQFLSHDPLGYVDSYNLYAYVGFDPINGWDPWGLGKNGFQDMTYMDWASYTTYDYMPRWLECSVRDCSYMPGVDEQLKREAAKRKKRQAAGVAVAAATAPFELLRKPSGEKSPEPLFDDEHVPEREGAFWGGVLTLPVSLGVNAAAGAAVGSGLAKNVDDLASKADDVGDVAGATKGADDVAGVAGAANSLEDWPELTAKLEAAKHGKGNFGIGSATREQAHAMGEAWVGPGYTVASDGKTLLSSDGLRQYRPPSFKPRLKKVQANFESRPAGFRQWQSNAHLDIVD